MAVKTQWFVPDLVGDEVDPFDDEMADVTEAGVTIDLRDDPDELFDKLRGLLDAEQHLYGRGVTCAVKNRRDTSCAACPFQGRYGELCNVGVQQEEVVTRMAFSEGPSAG